MPLLRLLFRSGIVLIAVLAFLILFRPVVSTSLGRPMISKKVKLRQIGAVTTTNLASVIKIPPQFSEFTNAYSNPVMIARMEIVNEGKSSISIRADESGEPLYRFFSDGEGQWTPPSSSTITHIKLMPEERRTFAVAMPKYHRAWRVKITNIVIKSPESPMGFWDFVAAWFSDLISAWRRYNVSWYALSDPIITTNAVGIR